MLFVLTLKRKSILLKNLLEQKWSVPHKKRGVAPIFFYFFILLIFYITYLDLPRFSAYRAFIHLWICLTGLTYEVSADWNMGAVLIHSFQAYRAVAQLTHLVV
jgi:hypothetical protein